MLSGVVEGPCAPRLAQSSCILSRGNFASYRLGGPARKAPASAGGPGAGQPSSAFPRVAVRLQTAEWHVSAWQKRRSSSGGAPSTAKKPRSEHGTDFQMTERSQYCQVCRAHWAEQKEADWDDAHIRRHCSNAKYGCATCQLRICKRCAPGYDHRTKTTSREDWPAKQPMPAKKTAPKRKKTSSGGGNRRRALRARGNESSAQRRSPSELPPGRAGGRAVRGRASGRRGRRAPARVQLLLPKRRS